MTSFTFAGKSSQRDIAEERVVKIAGYLRVCTGFLLMLTLFWLVFVLVWTLWTPTASQNTSLYEQLIIDGELKAKLTFADAEFSMQAKWLISAVGLIIALFSMYFFSRLHALFGNFRHKQIFIRRNSQLLRHLGYALIAGLVFDKVLKVVVLAANLAESGWWVLGSMEYTLGASTIFMVIIIGLLFLTAWILDIGRELFVDAELTI